MQLYLYAMHDIYCTYIVSFISIIATGICKDLFMKPAGGSAN